MLELGAIVGRIRLDQVLGIGGMGVVFAGTHLELEQHVAVKVLRDEFAQDTVIVARFLREARAAARLRTEHVCRVFDVGRLDNGSPYIVMELLAGSDLGTAIKRGPLPVAIAVDYVAQACVALAEAHAAGVVHRDLKPANLFVMRLPDGSPLVKVLDFGIAKAATAAEAQLTMTSSLIGTPAYMSPEQLRSARDVDLRTDIWALGATLYQLVTGRLPFSATSVTEMAVKVTIAPPDPIDVEPGLRAVILRCLEKDPEHRFASVGELVMALVPFGGTAMQRLVAQVASAIPVAPASRPLPAPVSFDARTAATAATAAGTAPPRPVTARRSRSTAIALAFGVLVVGGIVAGVALRGASDAPTPQVRDAQGSSRTGADPTATLPAPADASAIATAPADASTPQTPHVDASAIAMAPADARVPIDAHSSAGVMRAPVAMLNQNQRQQVELGLKNIETFLTNPNLPETAKQQALAGATQMACIIGDLAKVKSYFARISDAAARDKLRPVCSVYGVELPAQ